MKNIIKGFLFTIIGIFALVVTKRSMFPERKWGKLR